MPKIERMFAFIQADRDENDEGVIAWNIDGSWTPLVGADMSRAESLKPLAQEVADLIGKKVVLAEFSVRKDLEEISPARV